LRWIVLACRFSTVVVLTLFWGVLVILFSYFDRYGERAVRLVRFWARGVLWVCGVKVRVQGRERIDPTKAYLFMANHQSNFDIPILMVAFDTLQVRWVSKQEVRKVPIIGLCMQRTHQVLVDRDSPTQAVAVIRQVKALLEAGISAAFFPEGTRTRDGHLQPFKPGGFAVAAEAKVPVVPTVVRGSRALWPPGGVELRPGTVDVIFCQPIAIDPQLSKKAAREDLLRRVHAVIAEQLQEEIEITAPAASPAPVAASLSEHSTS
jgi:1-acyl-sn-glycerol-3-phosphate acyltransferase